MGTRYNVLIGMPGPSCTFETCMALALATRNHEPTLEGSGTACDNFNTLLCDALNMANAGEITHFAMLHADVNPCNWWLDSLIDEADRTGASFVSAVVPIKNDQGLTSCGIGNPCDPWHPFRRFTMREVLSLPETFTASDAGYAGWPLSHNHGCCVLDLRDRRFFTVNSEGELQVAWWFPRRALRGPNGKFVMQWESDDWYFSRQLHAIGIPSAITRKVKLEHVGPAKFPNDQVWGQAHDEESRNLWELTPGAL